MKDIDVKKEALIRLLILRNYTIQADIILRNITNELGVHNKDYVHKSLKVYKPKPYCVIDEIYTQAGVMYDVKYMNGNKMTQRLSYTPNKEMTETVKRIADYFI